MLNKLIHLIWLGEDGDKVAAKAVAHWKERGNGREVVLHTDDRCLLDAWRSVWDKHAKTFAMQSDLLRWSLLLTVGGWYFDCDVRSRLTIDDIEAECGLDGGQCFLTKVGRGQSPPFTDIAACNPDWLGRQTVLDCVPQQLDADVRYLTFANLMFWPMVVEHPELFAFGPEEEYGIVAATPEYRVFFRNAANLTFSSSGKPQRPKRIVQAAAGAERLGITWRDAAHYVKALTRWTIAGFPTRNPEETVRIEQTVCRPCDQYVDGRCKDCRCQVNKSMALVNKIKLLTERCPLGKW
jgi:hypothetical protein